MKTKDMPLRIAVLAILIVAFLGVDLLAQPPIKHRAKAYLNKTVVIIHAAKAQLLTGKNYTGDFSRALAHQKYARNMFLTGQFQKAIFHSHRARMLAYNVIRNNKGAVTKELESNSEEESLHANQPKDEELDRALIINDPKLTFDDRAATQAEVKGIDDK